MSATTATRGQARPSQPHRGPRLIELDEIRPGDTIATCHDKTGDTMPKQDEYTRVRFYEWHNHRTELHVNGDQCYTLPVWRK